MSWRERTETFLANWPEPHKSRMISRLAEENDLAENLGWTCLPDDRRGFGYCSFFKGRDHVWECSRGWVRASKDDNDRYQSHHYFRTLDDALKSENAYARLNQHGEFKSVFAPTPV